MLVGDNRISFGLLPSTATRMMRGDSKSTGAARLTPNLAIRFIDLRWALRAQFRFFYILVLNRKPVKNAEVASRLIV